MVQRALSRGGGGIEVRASAVLGAFPSYLVDELGRSRNTAAGYLGAIERAARFLGKPPHKVTADDLRRLLRETNYAPATKRGIVVAFHAYHSFGVVEGAWKMNGISELRTPKVIHEPRAPLSSFDAHRLLMNAISPIQTRIVYLGLYAGLRIQESSGLRERHWKGDCLSITREIAKAGKARKVPVHPELERKRELILSHSPTKGTAGTMFCKLRKRLELKDTDGNVATPHTLRRTFATKVYDEGRVMWEVVQKLLGHGTDVTSLYARVSWTQMVEAVAPLYFSDGQPCQLSLF